MKLRKTPFTFEYRDKNFVFYIYDGDCSLVFFDLRRQQLITCLNKETLPEDIYGSPELLSINSKDRELIFVTNKKNSVCRIFKKGGNK